MEHSLRFKMQSIQNQVANSSQLKDHRVSLTDHDYNVALFLTVDSSNFHILNIITFQYFPFPHNT